MLLDLTQKEITALLYVVDCHNPQKDSPTQQKACHSANTKLGRVLRRIARNKRKLPPQDPWLRYVRSQPPAPLRPEDIALLEKYRPEDVPPTP